jgi:hypothetical protein
MAKAAADRIAIERWEDEGGRALAREVSLSAHTGELPGADAEDSTSVGAVMSAVEHGENVVLGGGEAGKSSRGSWPSRGAP